MVSPEASQSILWLMRAAVRARRGGGAAAGVAEPGPFEESVTSGGEIGRWAKAWRAGQGFSSPWTSGPNTASSHLFFAPPKIKPKKTPTSAGDQGDGHVAASVPRGGAAQEGKGGQEEGKAQ
jgi:hypothetical protein